MVGGDALAQTGHRARARARAGYGRARAAGGRARGRGRGGGRGGGGRGARGPGRHRTVILRLFLHLHFLHDWSAAAGRHSTLHLLACSTLRSIHFSLFLSPTRFARKRGEKKSRRDVVAIFSLSLSLSLSPRRRHDSYLIDSISRLVGIFRVRARRPAPGRAYRSPILMGSEYRSLNTQIIIERRFDGANK